MNLWSFSDGCITKFNDDDDNYVDDGVTHLEEFFSYMPARKIQVVAVLLQLSINLVF